MKCSAMEYGFDRRWTPPIVRPIGLLASQGRRKQGVNLIIAFDGLDLA